MKRNEMKKKLLTKKEKNRKEKKRMKRKETTYDQFDLELEEAVDEMRKPLN